MKKNEKKMALFSLILLVSILFSVITILKDKSQNYQISSLPKVMILNIAGTIKFDTAEIILAQIEKISEDPSIVGVIIKIDSPGGTVGASQEIYSALLDLRKQNKKVVVSMGDIAASGGYYIASASELIVANPGTLTGSIGVIISSINFKDLLDKIGVKAVSITSGAMKDVLSPYRNMKPEEEKYIKEMVMNTYQQFFNAVLTGRKDKITEEELKKIADGRIFTGEIAKEKGLVDVLGSLNTAKEEMKKLLAIPQVEFIYPKDAFFKSLFKEIMKEESALSLLSRLNLPVMYYYGFFQ